MWRGAVRGLMWLGWGGLASLTLLALAGARLPRPTFEALGLLFGAGVLLNEAPRLFTRAPTSAPLAPALPAWVWLTPAAAAVLAFGHLAVTNQAPRPFVWMRMADDVLASVVRSCQRTSHPGHYAAHWRRRR